MYLQYNATRILVQMNVVYHASSIILMFLNNFLNANNDWYRVSPFPPKNKK